MRIHSLYTFLTFLIYIYIYFLIFEDSLSFIVSTGKGFFETKQVLSVTTERRFNSFSLQKGFSSFDELQFDSRQFFSG